MIDEFKDSVSSVLKERIVSPLFGSFLVSWCAWNLPLLYYVFTVDSKIPVEKRLQVIQTTYVSGFYILIGPLLSSIGLLLLYPFISGLVNLFMIYVDSETRKRSFAIQKKLPIPQKDALALYERLEKEEERNTMLFRQHEASILNLNSQLEETKSAYENKIGQLNQSHTFQVKDYQSKINGYENDITQIRNHNKDLQNKIANIEIASKWHLDRDKTRISFNDKVLERLFPPNALNRYRDAHNKITQSENLLNAFLTLDKDMQHGSTRALLPKNGIHKNELENLVNLDLININQNGSFSFTEKGSDMRIFYWLSEDPVDRAVDIPF
ncbi:hypothetical protein [Rufibacter immobilis]|uniref:hypothetical protein n=1 Tax=Rufibacter immobilis TaxID=1348778 RepID=UPI0035EE8314